MNCISVGLHYASVIKSIINGFIPHVREKQLTVFFAGYFCHLIHIAAEKGSKALLESVEELMMDIYYYLDKSSKRKSNLKKFQ